MQVGFLHMAENIFLAKALKLQKSVEYRVKGEYGYVRIADHPEETANALGAKYVLE